MKKFFIFVSVYLCLALISGCSTTTEHTTSSASWAFADVDYNGGVYRVTNEPVAAVGKELGEVTVYTDKEGTYSGNFSNQYPVGTKYFEIPGVDVKKSIAVKEQDGRFVRADFQWEKWKKAVN